LIHAAENAVRGEVLLGYHSKSSQGDVATGLGLAKVLCFFKTLLYTFPRRKDI
jgi:hypothetical protein